MLYLNENVSFMIYLDMKFEGEAIQWLKLLLLVQEVRSLQKMF